MKSVLMLYPHKSMVERDPRYRMSHSIAGGLLRALKVFYTERARIVSKQEWRARFGIINDLLDDYRRDGFRVGWGMFSEPSDLSRPDESAVSRYFRIMPEDYKIPVGITAHNHHVERKYPNEIEVVRKIQDLDELVVGGFHSGDCVPSFVQTARKLGINSRMDKDLTEDFFYKILFGLNCDLSTRLGDDEASIMKGLSIGERVGRHLRRVEEKYGKHDVTDPKKLAYLS